MKLQRILQADDGLGPCKKRNGVDVAERPDAEAAKSSKGKMSMPIEIF